MFRREATGAGVVMVTEAACAKLGWKLADQRCVVQGFRQRRRRGRQDRGPRRACARGLDISGGVADERGIDVAAAHEWVRQNGLPDKFPAQHVSNAELLELPCDLLVLAVLEDQLTGENAHRVDAKLIAEGANGPIRPGGRRDPA